MKTSITILILLVTIALQLILWAVSSIQWQREIDELREDLRRKARAFEERMDELQSTEKQ